jgi:hypothetical protein
MTMEEQQLSEMLKRTVPEPPLELSADRVTAQHFDKSPKGNPRTQGLDFRPAGRSPPAFSSALATSSGELT